MKYFGTDGIRGVANTELSPELAYRVGRALGYRLKGEGDFIVVGTDTRKSRDLLKSALSAGVFSCGLDIVDLGIIPSPAIAYFTRELKGAAGVVISASHNPGEFNGIKLFSSSGYKFSDEFEEEIEELIDMDIDYYAHGKDLGEFLYIEDEYGKYIDYLLGRIPVDLRGIKLCIDCGKGATLVIAEDLFKRAGAEVIAINTDFNGIDINDNCGSTNPDLIAELVVKENADIGLAFDGDGDRLIAVDEKGNIMDGDHYLAAIAYYMSEKGTLKEDTVVSTVMANIGLKKYLEDIGLNFVDTKVGDRYVLEEMLDKGYNLGGEQSGHFLLLDDNTTGCGLLSALKLLQAGVDLNMPISGLNRLMTSYPQVLINAQVTNETKGDYGDDDVISEAIYNLEKELEGSGRLLIRPSGTEPLVRVMLEGEDIEMLREKGQGLVHLIEERLN